MTQLLWIWSLYQITLELDGSLNRLHARTIRLENRVAYNKTMQVRDYVQGVLTHT